MPANRGRGVEGRLIEWLKAFEWRHDLALTRARPDVGSPEAIERSFSRLAEKTGVESGVSRAARFFGLDQEKPTHRALLLHILAEVVFYEPPKGRPKGSAKWSTEKLFLLGIRASALRKRLGSLKGNDAAKELKMLFKDDYRHDSIETVRQRLRDALQEFEKIQELFMSRMKEKGLSFEEYMLLLLREGGRELKEEDLREAYRSVHGRHPVE
jgi:hypothetical protein